MRISPYTLTRKLSARDFRFRSIPVGDTAARTSSDRLSTLGDQFPLSSLFVLSHIICLRIDQLIIILLLFVYIIITLLPLGARILFIIVCIIL